MRFFTRFTTSLSYGALATILGFLTHPYTTMQKVVGKHIPLVFIFFPALFCLLGWLTAKELAWLFLDILPFVGLWWFLEVWWLTLWGLWQITLVYLYLRFNSVHTES
jgi:hypothetical protein